MTPRPRTHETGWITSAMLGVIAALGFYVCTTQVPYIGWVVGVGAVGALGFGLRDARHKDALMDGGLELRGPARVSTFTKEYGEKP